MTMCAPVVQGYGLTETCAGSFISVPDLHVRVPSHLPIASHPWGSFISVPDLHVGALSPACCCTPLEGSLVGPAC